MLPLDRKCTNFRRMCASMSRAKAQNEAFVYKFYTFCKRRPCKTHAKGVVKVLRGHAGLSAQCNTATQEQIMCALSVQTIEYFFQFFP